MADPQATALTSLESLTMVSAAGAAPVMAIIEHLSATECRMRSVNDFHAGQHVAFTATLHGAPPIALEGTVISSVPSGPRRTYIVAVKSTPAQAEAIIKAVDGSRAHHVPHKIDVPTGNGLTRTSVRIPVDFDIVYTHAGSQPHVARATNISTGGVLMNSTDQLPVGASLELEIPLDGDRVKAHGRIVAHQSMSPNYNIAFFEMKDEARDTIARFVERHTG